MESIFFRIKRPTDKPFSHLVSRCNLFQVIIRKQITVTYSLLTFISIAEQFFCMLLFWETKICVTSFSCIRIYIGLRGYLSHFLQIVFSGSLPSYHNEVRAKLVRVLDLHVCVLLFVAGAISRLQFRCQI